MKLLMTLCCIVLFAIDESLTQNSNNAENSYSYAYTAAVGKPVADGLIEAKEWRSGDLVTGSYSLLDTDGRARLVIYRADKSGYSATVETNEVAYSENPANVVYINNGVIGTVTVTGSTPQTTSTSSSSSPASSSPASYSPASYSPASYSSPSSSFPSPPVTITSPSASSTSEPSTSASTESYV